VKCDGRTPRPGSRRWLPDGPAVAAAGESGVILQELQRGGDGRVVAFADLVGDLCGGQSPQDRHRFRRRKRQRVSGHRRLVRSERATQRGAREGVDSLSEQPGQAVGIDLARQAQGVGAAADPAARFLAMTDEIVLHPGRDLPGVVGPAVRRDLGQSHHRALASTGEAHREHPRCRSVCWGSREDGEWETRREDERLGMGWLAGRGGWGRAGRGWGKWCWEEAVRAPSTMR
jgi:hypothetical protein